MKAVLFASSPASDIKVDLAFINNFAATTAPVATSDSSKGYQVGSVWVNISTKIAYVCVDATVDAAVWDVTSSAETTPGQVNAPNASTPTGTGSNASVTGGAGGATSGAGGNSSLAGGAATAGNSNGGDAVVQGGAKAGTGVNGVAKILGTTIISQGAPATQDTAATLTAAQLLASILTSNPAGAINLQLPLATDLDAALPSVVAGQAFDFSVISLAGSTNLPTLTTNTGWTLVGSMTFTAVAGNAGRFRARKTGVGAWTLYRV